MSSRLGILFCDILNKFSEQEMMTMPQSLLLYVRKTVRHVHRKQTLLKFLHTEAVLSVFPVFKQLLWWLLLHPYVWSNSARRRPQEQLTHVLAQCGSLSSLRANLPEASPWSTASPNWTNMCFLHCVTLHSVARPWLPHTISFFSFCLKFKLSRRQMAVIKGYLTFWQGREG